MVGTGSPIRAEINRKIDVRPDLFILLRVATDHRFEVADPILSFRLFDF